MRWVIATLFVVLAAVAVYVSQDPEMSARYGQAVREADLSAHTKELITGGIAIAVLLYLGWFMFFRRERD